MRFSSLNGYYGIATRYSPSNFLTRSITVGFCEAITCFANPSN